MAKLEENIKLLEKLAKDLGEDTVGVDESLKYFEEAIGVSKACLAEINVYRGKLAELEAQIPPKD
ncbi:MAG: exodeoxyribonuclease VII small subunit [Christensenellaceae bacterium]|jgi:exodeoxyribonuclease VII small subunit|nr:exodeoxyribonuclease VII small subunit [Christensenellaceae bacterium]